MEKRPFGPWNAERSQLPSHCDSHLVRVGARVRARVRAGARARVRARARARARVRAGARARDCWVAACCLLLSRLRSRLHLIEQG